MASVGTLQCPWGFYCSRSSGGRIVLSTRPNLLSHYEYCILYVPVHALYGLAEMLTDSTLFLLDTMNRIMIEQHGKKLCSVTRKPTSSQTELQKAANRVFLA